MLLRNEYDGLGRRTKKHINTSSPLDGSYDEFQHFYYNCAWQILETRRSASETTAPHSRNKLGRQSGIAQVPEERQGAGRRDADGGL